MSTHTDTIKQTMGIVKDAYESGGLSAVDELDAEEIRTGVIKHRQPNTAASEQGEPAAQTPSNNGGMEDPQEAYTNRFKNRAQRKGR